MTKSHPHVAGFFTRQRALRWQLTANPGESLPTPASSTCGPRECTHARRALGALTVVCTGVAIALAVLWFASDAELTTPVLVQHSLAAAPAAAAPAIVTEAAQAPMAVAAEVELPPEPLAPPAPPAAAKGALPIGKGMWIWLPERADAGDPHAIVRRATAVGLTHILVRTGSSKRGFYAQAFLDAILPVAHASNIRVYGWDFPYLYDPAADVRRASAAISHTTPDGHRLDGFNADIETQGEGTNITAAGAVAYGTTLRTAVGLGYPLIVTVPNPTPAKVAGGYPYAEVLANFDGVSPMIYWLNRQPASDTANAMRFLAQFGKPVFPIGQAYDGQAEGGRAGVPPPEELIRFMQVAEEHGAAGVSFWSWQHADQRAWDTIGVAAEFTIHAGRPDTMTAGMIRSYQTLLNRMGFTIAADGTWGPATEAVVTAYQAAARLPTTGYIDEATSHMLLTPHAQTT